MSLNREQQIKLDHILDLIHEAYATLSFIYDNPSNVHETIYSERTGDYLDELDQLIQDYNNNLNLLEVH